MNNILIKTLEWVIKKLTSKEFVEMTKKLVSLVNDKDMSGAEKREWVVSELKKFFGEFSTFAINLAIEVSVAVLKSKMGKLDIKNG